MNSIPQASGIYKITCVKNGKIYIGSTKNFCHRWNEHRSKLRRNLHKNAHLQNAWNKYGEDAFCFEIVELASSPMLLDREQFWLDELKSYNHEIGFNIAKLAHAPTLGHKLSLEHIERIRAKNKGRICSAETRAKISAVHKGKVNSLEVRAKISATLTGRKQSPELVEKRIAPLRGRPISDEHKRKIGLGRKGKKHPPGTSEKISVALTGRKQSPEAIAKSANSRRGLKFSDERREKIANALKQKYVVTSPNGDDFVVTGLKDFCRQYNLDVSHLSKVRRGKLDHHKGWKCRYFEE